MGSSVLYLFQESIYTKEIGIIMQNFMIEKGFFLLLFLQKKI